MASMTLSITTNQGTLSRSINFSDANALRLVMWAKTAYQIQGEPELTNAQAFDALANGIFSLIRENVLSFERDAASQTAIENVQSIDFS